MLIVGLVTTHICRVRFLRVNRRGGVNLAFTASHLLDWLKSYNQIHAPAHGAYNGEIGAHFLILLKNGGLT